MAASDLERLEQMRMQLVRFKNDYATQSGIIGTDKDNDAHRKKIQRIAQRYRDVDSKATTLLSKAPASGPEANDWNGLRIAIRNLRTDFEGHEREVRARENAHPLAGAAAAGVGGGGGNGGGGGGSGGGDYGGRGGHAAVKMQDFRQVDDAELLTEEALQTEKLEGILEVERDMNELRGMYHELHSHVEYQQTGLNTAEANIDQAQTHVEKGVTELKSANKLQKSSRKKMFILLGIIVVIVVIVIVIVVVMKK